MPQQVIPIGGAVPQEIIPVGGVMPSDTGSPSLQIVPGTKPADAIAQMKAFNQSQIPETEGAQGGYGTLAKVGYGIAKQVNPINILTGLYGAVTSPWQTVKGLGQAQLDEFAKGKAMYDEGRHSEAMGHTLAGLLPLLGPAAAGIGENIGQGNVSEGIGETIGLVGTVGLPAVARGAGRAVSSAGKTSGVEKIATIADQLAAKKFTEAVAPRSTAAKNIRLSNDATKLAPQMLREADMGAITRTGYGNKVKAKLAEVGDQLDEVSDARNAGRAFPTRPLIDELKERRKAFTSEAVEGSLPERAITERTSSLLDERGQPIKVTEQSAVPIGKDLVSEHHKVRVAQIDKAIAELEALGPLARYDAIKTIRQSYDKPAKTTYSPSMTADFLVKNDEALGAADVTGVLREGLGRMDPATAKANAPYAMWRKMDTVIQAAEELDRARPAIGRKIMGGLTGAVLGSASGGTVGGIVGAILGRMADSALVGSPTTKILTARALTQLSDAIRKGDVSVAQSAIKKLRAYSLMGQTQPKEPQ